ncbi:MAG: FmdE family protein, partial [Coriobacteriales bacterium]|nr:FmdE family protein [Coriobacteriales bacterium]
MKRTFEEDLTQAIAFHGHLCAGQILGTRITRIGLEHFGIEEPEAYKDLIAFVEADRCVADAVCSVARCQLGRRRLKWHDFGKMAATFYDINQKTAIRIIAVNESRPAPNTHGDELIAFYQAIPDDQMFKIQNVEVNLTEYDLPGKPKRRVTCEKCGEGVMDNRDVQVNG